jgi:O-antigen ligase
MFDLVCGAVLLVPLGSVVTWPIVPIPLRLMLAGLWLLAVVRPHVALLGLALLVPFGSTLIAACDAAPIQYTEALVLATLSGLLIAAAREPHAGSVSEKCEHALLGAREALRRRAPSEDTASPSLARPAAIFSTVVICSLAVVLAVSQVGIGMRRLFFSNIATFLARDYLVGAPGQWIGVAAACQLLEGVLLLLLVIRSTRHSVVRPLQIMRTVTAAAAAAAAMSLIQLVMALSAGGSIRDLLTRLLRSRISVHVADVNAAGSYYAMAGFVALALALHEHARGRRRLARVWGVVTAALFVAMWLTGSRTAAVSAAVLICMAIAAGRDAWRQRPLWLIAAGVGLVAVVGGLAVGFDPRAVAGRGLARTLESRIAFITTGLRMIASAPVFGVGIGRYFEMSGRFMPSSIYWFFFHENAHNNFLQIAGELGLAGLAMFVWLIVAAALRLLRGLRASSGDRLLAGALAGLAAFVATWLSGHPLLTPEVAFPFWILAGAAIARADGNRRTPLVPSAGAGSRSSAAGRSASVLVAAALLLLIASVPMRARRESATLDLSAQTFGFYEWEGDVATGRARWTSPSAGFFVPANTIEVEIPLRAAFSDRRPKPTIVSIAIDGRVFHRLERSNGDWFTLRLRLPALAVRATQPRRLDIITNPPWSPAEVLGTHDSRVLGVQLGEVTTR